jgi:outer membrane protein
VPRNLMCALLLIIPATALCAPPPVAPPSPTRPWPLPEATSVAHNPAIETSGAPYDLAGLIDLAQRISPETRQAWDEARAAAAGAGLARSAYLPQLAVEALAGAQRTPLPAPASVVPKGYFVSDTREFIPSLTIKWLLFDFGRRDAARDRADATLFVANAAFTGAHQTLVFKVTRDYYAVRAAQGKERAAQKGLETASIEQQAVAARRKHELATVVEVARADRQVAQARLALVRTGAARTVALSTLLADIGLPPETALTLAPDDMATLPLPPASDVARYVDDALARRPDLLAAQGKVEAAEAGVRAAKADDRPTVSLLGQAFLNDGRLRSDGGSWSSVHRPGGALFVQFSWPLYDGGLRRSSRLAAEAARDAAQDSLEATRRKAEKQVASAFHALETALAEVEAAHAVTLAATVSHDAALSAYRHGLATFDELSAEGNALATAESDEEDARANAFASAAGLALATGGASSGAGAP